MTLSPAKSTRRARVRWGWLIARAAFGLALVICVILMIIDRVRPDLTDGLRGAALDQLTPVLTIATAPVRGVRAAGDWIGSYLNVRSENARLRADNERLRLANQRTRALERDLTTLRGLLHVAEPPPRTVAGARVVGSSSAAHLDSAILSAGRADGVRPGMPVRDALGIVGRISTAGRHASRLLLATDINSRIPVRVVRTGETAMAAGDGAGAMTLMFLRPDADIRTGDLVVTSGHGQMFPPNIPVARVSATSGEAPAMLPAAGLSRLSHVLILAPYLWQPAPVDAPAPPAP